jgi:hypothetical protein
VAKKVQHCLLSISKECIDAAYQVPAGNIYLQKQSCSKYGMAWVLFAVSRLEWLLLYRRMNTMVAGMIYCYQELHTCLVCFGSTTKTSGPTTANINTFSNNLSLLIISVGVLWYIHLSSFILYYMRHQYDVTISLPPLRYGGLGWSCTLWLLYLQANTRIVLSSFSSCVKTGGNLPAQNTGYTLWR